MIIGIGIDTVEIKRFKIWPSYPKKKLLRLFSTDEISYCLSCPIKGQERIAVRFAAREALFKAICQAIPDYNGSFLTLCKNVRVERTINSAPFFRINWETILPKNSPFLKENISCLASLTHTRQIATSIVILQYISRKI